MGINPLLLIVPHVGTPERICRILFRFDYQGHCHSGNCRGRRASTSVTLGRTWQTDGDAYENHGLIFCQPNGRPLHGHNVVRRDFHKVSKLPTLRKELAKRGVSEEALPRGLPQIRFHDLRHCPATLLLQQGVHPKVVQERLGHTTIGMTLDTYSHVLPGMQEHAVADLEIRLFPMARTGSTRVANRASS